MGHKGKATTFYFKQMVGKGIGLEMMGSILYMWVWGFDIDE
jgi:hypothetical protein